MKKYVVSLMALLALTGLVLLAADVDGTWTMTTEGKNGPQTQTLTLMSKGTELMGKMEGGRGGAIDISEGKVDGGNVSFKVVREGKNGKQEQEYKGMVKGGDLVLTTQGRGGPQDLTFKKK
ncbi:MAG TPA: hypothetical protein VGJ09_07470 [Bryobacteraceae bacterium]|jgi:hypothetical protein